MISEDTAMFLLQTIESYVWEGDIIERGHIEEILRICRVKLGLHHSCGVDEVAVYQSQVARINAIIWWATMASTRRIVQVQKHRGVADTELAILESQVDWVHALEESALHVDDAVFESDLEIRYERRHFHHEVLNESVIPGPELNPVIGLITCDDLCGHHGGSGPL